MKATELHFQHIKKQIPWLTKQKCDVGLKNVIIRADSKGRALQPFLNNTKRINLIYRSGSKLSDNFMQEYTLNRIRNTHNPIVILFFGTCELTNKEGKYILLPDNIENRINEVIERYANYKKTILKYNPDSIVIFLQCPYFSLIIWNFLKKHPFPGSFEKDQKTLEDSIILFNKKIKELNGDRAIPNLNLDFMYSIKKK